MKISLAFLLASCVSAWPRTHLLDETEPVSQRSRVTAFVNTDSGLKVECWEITSLIPRQPGLRNKGDDLQGVELLTWPTDAAIYPPSNRAHSNGIQFSLYANLFTVKGGLVFIESFSISTSAKEPETFVFSDENGDDWFYFEDRTEGSQCAKPAENQLSIRTASGSDTTLLRFMYDGQPQHTVVHEGRCNFAGLKPQKPNQRNEDRYSSRRILKQL